MTTADDPAATGPVTAATDRFIATVDGFDAAALAAPSRLPEWTRAHVVAHVARHADAMVNLLTWARTGTVTYQYASADDRLSGIEAGAGMALDDLVADLRAAAERFAAAVNEMPDEAWGRQVRRGPAGSGETIPARRVLWSRLQEVEIHHVDLDAGYQPAEWTPWFTDRMLSELVRSFSMRDDAPRVTLRAGTTLERIGDGAASTVSGAPTEIVAWLIGRSKGSSLEVEPSGPLPALPAWK